MTEAVSFFPGIHWKEMKLRDFYSWNTTSLLGCPKSIMWNFDFACASGPAPKQITKIKSRGRVLLFFNVRDQVLHFWIEFGRHWFPPTSEALASHSWAAEKTLEPGCWLSWGHGAGGPGWHHGPLSYLKSSWGCRVSKLRGSVGTGNAVPLLCGFRSCQNGSIHILKHFIDLVNAISHCK